MIFRPVLMQMGIDGCLEFNLAACKIDPIIKDKTLMCAASCVNTAVSLIDFLYKRYVVELKSNKEWWWDPYRKPDSPSTLYSWIDKQLTRSFQQILALQVLSLYWLKHLKLYGHMSR